MRVEKTGSMTARRSEDTPAAAAHVTTNRASLGPSMPEADAAAIRNACISSETRTKYTGNINGIKKWIREELSHEDPDTTRFFDCSNDLNLAEFTPAVFEKFLVYKRSRAKSVTLSGYRSAIRDFYRLKRVALPVEYGDDMKQYFSGIKRLEADQLQSSSPKNSGKQPLTYSLYKELCESTLSRNNSGFSHLFLTTQWNLMCRSASVQTLQTQHFLDKDDSVGAIFFKAKTNQDGSGPRDPRHLYANAFNPSTCWVTALGVYLACNPRMHPGPLFPGSDPKVRFGKALGRLIANDGADKIYGTHSLRKGVATFACGRSTGGPSIVSVCLRCGWSLGGVQDRYFRYEAAGDQYLGRVVAGLPVNDSKFAALPPHFRDNSDDMVKSGVEKMFPGLALENNLSSILRLCLASLVHHASFLIETLPHNHPLLSTHIFANPGVLPGLGSRLEAGDSSWMEPTGIPPHITLFKKLDQQQNLISTLPDMLEKIMEHVLEKKVWQLVI